MAEKIQDLRNRTLREEFLSERGHRLALTSVSVGGLSLADLCDPHDPVHHDVAPDRLAYPARTATQEIAARIHSRPDLAGFRW